MLEQPAKARLPIVVIELGKANSIKLEHPEKASVSIVVKELLNTKRVMFEQPEKARPKIEVIEFGIFNEVIKGHEENALELISTIL